LRFMLPTICLLCSASVAAANNLTISNVKLGARDSGADTVQVEFDIGWDNSWRNDTNYDAVWVFVKIEKVSTGVWSHGPLENFGSNPVDTSPGSNSDLEIIVPPDKVGAFIQRKSGNTGAGSISSTGVKLTVDYGTPGLADTDQIVVRVFGVEMVYVPEGDFYIGDGNGSSESASAFHTILYNNTVAQVTSALLGDVVVDANVGDDSQLESGGVGIDGDGGLDTDNDGDIDNAGFPTGYQYFYLMKY